MSVCQLKACPPEPAAANARLAGMSPEARIAWAAEHLPQPFALTSSFGAQSAVMLHMVTRLLPDIPVVVVDTGYLFPETYRFIDQLAERLALNLEVVRPRHSPAWQEARHGRLWEAGREGLERYNRINKVEPLRRAFARLGVATWLAGLRRVQSDTRANLDFLAWDEARYKLLPILDWTDRDMHRYLTRHDLPYHPLWDAGYVSIGDWHTTRSLAEVDDPEELRFFGLMRECGIHEEL